MSILCQQSFINISNYKFWPSGNFIFANLCVCKGRCECVYACAHVHTCRDHWKTLHILLHLPLPLIQSLWQNLELGKQLATPMLLPSLLPPNAVVTGNQTALCRFLQGGLGFEFRLTCFWNTAVTTEPFLWPLLWSLNFYIFFLQSKQQFVKVDVFFCPYSNL